MKYLIVPIMCNKIILCEQKQGIVHKIGTKIPIIAPHIIIKTLKKTSKNTLKVL